MIFEEINVSERLTHPNSQRFLTMRFIDWIRLTLVRNQDQNPNHFFEILVSTNSNVFMTETVKWTFCEVKETYVGLHWCFWVNSDGEIQDTPSTLHSIVVLHVSTVHLYKKNYFSNYRGMQSINRTGSVRCTFEPIGKDAQRSRTASPLSFSIIWALP